MQNGSPEAVYQSLSPTPTRDFLSQELEVTERSLSQKPELIFLVDILEHLFPADSPPAFSAIHSYEEYLKT